MHWLIVALGGALGAMARYGTQLLMNGWLGKGWPLGTLTVNVIGSALMGLFYVWVVERGLFGQALTEETRLLVMVGFLGALTTFSTFSLETLLLMQSGEWLRAGLNVVLNVLVCLAAVWLGVVAARAV